MTKAMTVDERILAAFVDKLEADRQVPPEVVNLIRNLCETNPSPDSNAILDAVKRGVEEHAKNSTP